MSSTPLLVSRLVPRRSYASFAFVLLVSAVVGYAGGESSKVRAESERTVTETRPTEAAYIAKGDALCADVQVDAAKLLRDAEALQAKEERLTKPEFLRRAAAFWSKQIAFIERFHRRFKALGAPPGDEARVREFLRSIDDGLRTAREIQTTLGRGKEVPRSLVEEYGRAVVRGNTLAQAYGFQVCGRQG